MKKILLTTAFALGLCLGASADTVAQWNFNNGDGSATTGTLSPAIGSGSATNVGPVSQSFSAAGGGSDPLGAAADNSSWRLANFPLQGTSNKTCGAQFAVDTTGYENITLAFDLLGGATANRYWRVQYSIDNGATWVDKDVMVNLVNGAFWSTYNASFVTVPGVNNNPGFKVRLLSEFQSTAIGGAASYVAVGNANGYVATAAIRLDMVTFSGDTATGEVNIVREPANQAVAVGQPARFDVAAGGGSSAITYQWRKNSSVIAGATNASYLIAAAQHADVGSYDVIVTNAVNCRTSAVATLTVRDPLSLAWNGFRSSWDTSTLSWLNTDGGGNAAYTDGDQVLFDNQGIFAPEVNLAETFNPSSVTVAADSGDANYTFLSYSGGKIAGPSGLTKRGSGTLVLATDNTYTGPTVIEAGTVQVGAADVHGAIGAGPITNSGALVFNRTDTLVVAGDIHGSGSITNLGGIVHLTGANVYDGPISANSGTLLLWGNQVVNSTDMLIVPSTATGAAGSTKLGISGGMVVGSGTTLHMSGSMASPDLRCTFMSSSGTNIFNGSIVLDGSGNNGINADDAAELRVNGNISCVPGFAGILTLRGVGVGSGILNGTINLPGWVNKTDSGTWTINSTGNSWPLTSLASGILRIGVNDALPTGLTLYLAGTTTLDLAGFNQRIYSMQMQDTTGTKIITNSSATSDSTLTMNNGTFGGLICDGLTRKTALTLDGTTLTLGGINTYSGETTVLAGTLSLSGAGSIAKSAVINLAGGALNVSARSDATLTVGAAQTLKGNGTVSITGKLVNNGTIELKVNKASGIVSNDKVGVSGQVTYGGTLKLVLSGEALSLTNTIPVVAAGTYAGGAFATIDPAVPAPGLTWDTSTLATDGILRLKGPLTIDTTVLSAAGTDIIFSGTGGAANGTFSVLASTNVAAPLATWTTVQTGSFDGSGNFSVTNAIAPGVAQRFFRLQVP